MIGYGFFADSIDRLAVGDVSRNGAIPWACPVPHFGRLPVARVATLGINPSIREFVGSNGTELKATSRRFPTLESLQLRSWDEADSSHIRVIANSCADYFSRNPYRRWFDVLNRALSRAGFSYYGDDAVACHLDLVPYATVAKWSELSRAQRHALLRAGSHILAAQLAASPVRLLILNGRAVSDQFASVSNVELVQRPADAWRLTRRSGRVPGVSYAGTVSRIGDRRLENQIDVVGFNHNLQSSFGVTAAAIDAIAAWIEVVTRNSRR